MNLTSIEQLIEEAKQRVQKVKASYPGCEGAKNVSFGGALTDVTFKQTSGAPPSNGVLGAGWDRSSNDYGLFTRAIRTIESGATYHRYIKNNRNGDSIAEDTNNIALPVTFCDLNDFLLATFGTTDSAKTITLSDSATKWSGRMLFISISKAATTGSRAVTLVSAASESTIVPPGGGTPTTTATLISGLTGAKSAGVLLVGDGFLLYPTVF